VSDSSPRDRLGIGGLGEMSVEAGAGGPGLVARLSPAAAMRTSPPSSATSMAVSMAVAAPASS